MEANKRKVLEALQMQPLSEEEKSARHILGRLYGPIATCKEKTRNGRGYNKELWERALADEIFKEKLATKSLFLELGHPADREETDMTCVCACIPEMPKIVNDDLYAYVDILDTPNGKLLKTLCDYGFVPGISSRGSGDIMANDEVDPETFFLETWDIVQLPAVKKARLQVCESFDGKKPLKAVLQESLDTANDDDKKVMKESLENLNIKLNESEAPALEDIPMENPEENLPEGYTGNPAERTTHLEYTDDDPTDGKAVLPDNIEKQLTEDEEATTEEEPKEDAAEVEEPKEDEEKPEEATFGAFIDKLSDFDKELPLEWTPIVIDDKEYKVDTVNFDNSEDKIIATVSYALPEEENTINDEEAIEEPAEDNAEEAPEEAGDAGDEEVFESLKEAVRQKDLLEAENKELKNQKTVSDAEVKKLNEELEKYKNGFMRVSELASKSSALEKENKALNEQVVDLKTKVENHISLTESVNADKAKINELTEKLAKATAEAEETEKSLTEELQAARKKATDRTNLAKSYKAKYDAVIERYVANKAKMLGVRPQDITSKLAESYSLDDIDNVCTDLLNESRSPFSLGFGTTRAKVQESVKPQVKDNTFDDLLNLAGLDYSDLK